MYRISVPTKKKLTLGNGSFTVTETEWISDAPVGNLFITEVKKTKYHWHPLKPFRYTSRPRYRYRSLWINSKLYAPDKVCSWLYWLMKPRMSLRNWLSSLPLNWKHCKCSFTLRESENFYWSLQYEQQIEFPSHLKVMSFSVNVFPQCKMHILSYLQIIKLLLDACLSINLK